MHNIYIGGPAGVGKTTVGRLVGATLEGARFLDGSEVFADATGIDPRSVESTLPEHRKQNDEALERLLAGSTRIVLAGHFMLSRALVSQFEFACLLIVPQEVLLNRRLRDRASSRSLNPRQISEECDLCYGRFCEILGSSRLPCFAVPAVAGQQTVADGILRLAAMMSRINGH